MAITLNIGPACAGTNHYDVTATVGGRVVTIPVTHTDYALPLTDEEMEVFVLTLLKLVHKEENVKAPVGFRAALAAADLQIQLRPR